MSRTVYKESTVQLIDRSVIKEPFRLRYFYHFLYLNLFIYNFFYNDQILSAYIYNQTARSTNYLLVLNNLDN